MLERKTHVHERVGRGINAESTCVEPSGGRGTGLVSASRATGGLVTAEHFAEQGCIPSLSLVEMTR